jgi:hypothetical protein
MDMRQTAASMPLAERRKRGHRALAMLGFDGREPSTISFADVVGAALRGRDGNVDISTLQNLWEGERYCLQWVMTGVKSEDWETVKPIFARELERMQAGYNPSAHAPRSRQPTSSQQHLADTIAWADINLEQWITPEQIDAINATSSHKIIRDDVVGALVFFSMRISGQDLFARQNPKIIAYATNGMLRNFLRSNFSRGCNRNKASILRRLLSDNHLIYLIQRGKKNSCMSIFYFGKNHPEYDAETYADIMQRYGGKKNAD